MKKRLIIGLFAVLGLVFWADNRWSDRDDRDALFLPGLREPGRLKAVLVPDLGVFRIQEGLPTGFDYQLLKWFADDAQLKLEITFAPTRLAALDSVREGRADVACGNLLAQDAVGMRFGAPLWKGPMYWMSTVRESVLPGDTLLALGESPYNTELAQWAKTDGGIHVSASTASNLFLELLNEPLQRATQLAVAPKWMALAWKRKNRHGSLGVLSGAEVAVGWAFRAESVALEEQISSWLTNKKSSRRYRHWFQTHYAQGSLRPANYSISTVDPMAKKWADAKGLYDAPLVLAVAYRESRFQRLVVSPAGAVGLMQLMPRTGKKFVPKGTDLYHPEGNLRAGINYLHFLDNFWANRQVPAPDRLYFVLASYNTGPAPVVRAYKRARSKGLDPTRWHGNVETVLRSPGRRYAREIAEIATVYRNYWRLKTPPQPEGFSPPVPVTSIKTGSK